MITDLDLARIFDADLFTTRVTEGLRARTTIEELLEVGRRTRATQGPLEQQTQSMGDRHGVKPCLHQRAAHRHGTHLAYVKDGCRCDPCSQAARREAKRQRYRTAMGSSTYVDAGAARAHVRSLLETLTVSQIEHRSGVNRTAIRALIGGIPNHPASRRITRTTETRLLAVDGVRIGPETNGLVGPTGTRRRIQALVALGHPVSHLRTQLGASTRTMWALTRSGEAGTIRVSTRDAVRDLYDKLSLTVPNPSRSTTAARNLAARRSWVPPLAWDDDQIDEPTACPARGYRGPEHGECAAPGCTDAPAVRGLCRQHRRTKVVTRSDADVRLDDWLYLVQSGENSRRAIRRAGFASLEALRLAAIRRGRGDVRDALAELAVA